MPDFQDPLLAAAVRLGFLKKGVARKAEREAERTGQTAEVWLLGRGILTPREVERIRRTTRSGRRPTTRAGVRVEKTPATGLALALTGFLIVLGGGLFLFKDRIFPPAKDGPSKTARSSSSGAGTPAEPIAPPPVEPANPSDAGPPPIPAPAPEQNAPPPDTPSAEKKDPEENGAGDPPAKKVEKKQAVPATAPPKGLRDPKVRKAADAAFDRGEKLNQQVGSASGPGRTDLMEKALEAYSEALSGYWTYSGHRVPKFLEERFAEVNSRVALLRKLLPPERAAKYMRKLTDPDSTPAELLGRAEVAIRESPLNHTYNYMLFQRVLDEYPGSTEAMEALRRIGEIGWMEIEAVTRRRFFLRLAAGWQRTFMAGKYDGVKKGLERVNRDPDLRGALRTAEWGWYLAAERALRVPAMAMANLKKGQVVALRKHTGGTMKGEVTEVFSFGVRLGKGRIIKVGDLHLNALSDLAFNGRMTGARYLTLSCFLAFQGRGKEAMDTLERARKNGSHVEDLAPVIERLALVSKDK